MCSELVFRLLIFKRWLSKVCTFLKVNTTGVPEYLFDLIPQANHLYNTRLSEDVTTFYSRTDVFKYSFVQSKILEWNKLDRTMQQSTIKLSFRNSLLKIGQTTPKPVYNMFDSNGLKLLTRLGLRFSYLDENRFNHNFNNCVNLLCHCSLEIESVSHFFLHCHCFTDIRKTICNESQSVKENILSQSVTVIVELSLHGSNKFKFQQNCSLVKSVQLSG